MDVAARVDRLFREESGRLTALLTRILGADRLTLAEDAVQDAFVAALRHWPMDGVPSSPAAWLLQVARRRALDVLRREQAFADRLPMVASELDAAGQELAQTSPGAAEADPFADERLRMILLCCHPAVSPVSRVALPLKSVGGFSVGEIARAFVADARAMAQRLVRARRALRDARADFAMPEGEALRSRLETVQDVLYLMFNEAHSAHAGEALLRRDLAQEAIRLAERLLRDPRTETPAGHALAALFCFHASRFEARDGADGVPVRLAEQDRTRWNTALIARGFAHLERAADGPRITAHHVEAEIASLHAIAPTWEATDWARIEAAYDRLLALAPSPVAALNRVVAVRHARGLGAAWAELQRLEDDAVLARYPLTPAVRGWLLAALDRPADARLAWARARALATSVPFQRQADQRLGELDERLGPPDVDSGAARPS